MMKNFRKVSCKIIIHIIVVEKKFNTHKKRIDDLEKKFQDFESVNLQNEFLKFKGDYDKLFEVVQENKNGLNSLLIKLNQATETSQEGDANLKKKLDILKKNTDDKMLELNTKLELFLNNMGREKENGESNIQKKFDLSGLNDFMQKIISLENRFEDFVSIAKIDEVHEQLKNLDVKKMEKTDLEKINEFNKYLDNKLHENKEKIDNINQNIEAINKQINNINIEQENLKNMKPIIKEEGTDLKEVRGSVNVDVSDKISLDAQSLDLYLAKYVLKSNFDDFLKINKEKINKINGEIDKLKNQINELKNSLNKKAEAEDLSELRDFLTTKLEELINECTKKFSDKNETMKYLKYLEEQIRNLYLTSKSKTDSHMPENWLLATKPISGFNCAACESYIGDLKTEKEKFIPWNKLPTKEGAEKLYRMGNGFSKMLSMLNIDSCGNVYLNPNADPNINSDDDENKTDSRRKEKNLSTLLMKNKTQRESYAVLNENQVNTIKIGKRTQNKFIKKEELKTTYLPKIKKEILMESRENIKDIEENPKITKIFKKSHSSLHLKENN